MDERDDVLLTVTDDEGARGACRPFADDAEHVWVAFGNHSVLVPADQLVAEDGGDYRLRMRISDHLGATGDGGFVIPVAEEVVAIEKRIRETGKVRIHKTIREEEEEVTLPLIRETVEIERVPVDRVVESPLPPRQEGDTLIVPVVEEVLVVEKKLVLKEEVHIRTVRAETEKTEHITLRKEEVTIDRSATDDEDMFDDRA
jgi:uncharacterized protein (TIGR02271 family)